MDYISVRRELIDVLPFMSDEAVRVFLVLLARNEEQKTIKVGLSFQELVRTADVGRKATQRGLDFLSMPTNLANSVPLTSLPFVTILPKSKHHVIVINEYWIGEKGVQIPFTYTDTDETKIEVLERELRRVEIGKTRVTESGIVEILDGETRELVREIEAHRALALNPIEIWLLATSVRGFGPERVLKTWRRMRNNKNAIRAVSASLNKGIAGKGATKKDTEPFQKVTYKDLD